MKSDYAKLIGTLHLFIEKTQEFYSVLLGQGDDMISQEVDEDFLFAIMKYTNDEIKWFSDFFNTSQFSSFMLMALMESYWRFEICKLGFFALENLFGTSMRESKSFPILEEEIQALQNSGIIELEPINYALIDKIEEEFLYIYSNFGLDDAPNFSVCFTDKFINEILALDRSFTT